MAEEAALCTVWGATPPNSTSGNIKIVGSQMSRSDRPAGQRRRRSVLGVGMAAGAAFAAALIGLANAPVAGADPAVVDVTDSAGPDPFQDLHGTVSPIGLLAPTLDNFLDLNNPFATATDEAVDIYIGSDADPLSDLVGAIDPNAFGANGLPTDFFGDLATELDYGFRDVPNLLAFLAPSLGPLLDPLVGLTTEFGTQLDPVIDSLLAGMP